MYLRRVNEGKTLPELTAQVARFAEERGWDDANPNQLLVALLGELGELSEHYQWQDAVPDWDEEKRREVAYEFVDVLFYLLRLAHASGIDVGHYFEEKLPKLEEKYPANASAAQHKRNKEEYRRTGRNRLYE